MSKQEVPTHFNDNGSYLPSLSVNIWETKYYIRFDLGMFLLIPTEVLNKFLEDTIRATVLLKKKMAGIYCAMELQNPLFVFIIQN